MSSAHFCPSLARRHRITTNYGDAVAFIERQLVSTIPPLIYSSGARSNVSEPMFRGLILIAAFIVGLWVSFSLSAGNMEQALKLPPGPLPFPGKLTDGKYDVQHLEL